MYNVNDSKMKLIKLKTTNSWKAGQKNILPYVGEVAFDDNAEIKVSEDVANKLIEFSEEFFLAIDEEEDIKKKSEDSEELGKSEGTDIAPQVEDLGDVSQEKITSNQADIIREKLAELTVKEIKEQYLSKFPEELVKGLKNREQYIEFLVNELTK